MADARTPAKEPLQILMRRWPDQVARFELLRPARKPRPIGFGLSLAELRELRGLIDVAEEMLATEPNRPAYEVADLKLSAKARSEAA